MYLVALTPRILHCPGSCLFHHMDPKHPCTKDSSHASASYVHKADKTEDGGVLRLIRGLLASLFSLVISPHFLHATLARTSCAATAVWGTSKLLNALYLGR